MFVKDTIAAVSFEAVLTFLSHEADESSLLFFDIETTGLSPETSYVYLIGALFHENGRYILRQWFSQDIKDEPDLLTSFFSFLHNYSVLVHFNGSTFDLPFLEKRSKKYDLLYNFNDIFSLDIYRLILPYRKAFALSSFRQVALEAALGIHREDKCSGGDLIPMYFTYLVVHRYKALRDSYCKLGEPKAGDGANNESNEYIPDPNSGLPSIPHDDAESLLFLMLQHNREDVLNLPTLASLLACPLLFRSSISVVNNQALFVAGENTAFSPSACAEYSSGMKITIESYSLREGSCIIKGMLSMALPLSFSYDFIKPFPVKLRAAQNRFVLSVSLYSGTLKHFFPNYKDYYFLPQEDTAVHKSVAQFVDRSARRPAKQADCYVKKTGLFLPQTKGTFSPEYRLAHKDKYSFFEAALLSSENAPVRDYCQEILRSLRF